MSQLVQVDAAQLFNMPSLAGLVLDVPQDAHLDPLVPDTNPAYVFRRETLRVVMTFIFNGSKVKRGMYLFGPSGSGKTSVILETAGRLGLRVHYLCATDELSMSDLVGSFQFTEPGKMEFVYGPLALAARDGDLFILDEMDHVDVPAGVYGILEGRPLKLPNGEIIKPHPNFRFFATGNTSGSGDWTGKYSGTRKQNEALLQRFKPLEVGYPDAGVEVQILDKFLGDIAPEFDDATRETYATKMVQVAGMVRQRQMDESDAGDAIEIDFSPRTLISWCEEMVDFQGCAAEGISPLYYGLDRAVLDRAMSTTRDAVRQIVHDVFGA